MRHRVNSVKERIANFMICTENGDVLGYRVQRKAANDLASQQVRQLKEVIYLKRYDASLGTYVLVQKFLNWL
jgi:hypothetical protein